MRRHGQPHGSGASGSGVRHDGVRDKETTQSSGRARVAPQIGAFAQPRGGARTFRNGKRAYDRRVPYPRFDEVIHERTRLQLSGLLAAVVEAEFATLRDSLSISDSALSKHIRALEVAGYVTTRRLREGSRTYTLVAMSEDGRHAFCGHVAEIQRLAGMASMRGKGAAGAARVPRKHITLTRRPTG